MIGDMTATRCWAERYRRGRALVAAAIMLGSLLGIAPAAPPAAAAPAPEAAAPRWLTLKNGARLLLVPDPRAAAVSVGLWVETGVRFERPGIIGLSHLVEHLSARGIAPGGDAEVRRRIEAAGGTSASFTTADFTCFTHTVPRASLEMVLQLEAARFSARPSQAMLDLDRAAVRAENRNRSRLNPLERPLQTLYATAFPTHPYRFPVIGLDEDLGRITLKECQDYLQARYTPARAVFTVVGDFDADEALALARRHLESIPGRGKRDDARTAREPEPGGERRHASASDLPVPLLTVGWRVPAGAPDEVAELELISTLLTGRSASRLARRLIAEQQTCLFARSGRERLRDATLFWAAAALRPGADTAAVESTLVAEIERLASEPVSGEELDRARKQLEVALLVGRQGASDRGQALGAAQMIAGDWHDADRQLERLRALTPADLQRAAARTLVAARRNVVWMAASTGGGAGSR